MCADLLPREWNDICLIAGLLIMRAGIGAVAAGKADTFTHVAGKKPEWVQADGKLHRETESLNGQETK